MENNPLDLETSGSQTSSEGGIALGKQEQKIEEKGLGEINTVGIPPSNQSVGLTSLGARGKRMQLERQKKQEEYLESEDGRKFSLLVKKSENNELFTKDDLMYLYEINSPFRYMFRYRKDPRIDELRKKRNTKEDVSIIFECTHTQIAGNLDEVNENTKVYIGALESGIFQKLPENIEHFYTSFPDEKIYREDLLIGGKTAEELKSKLEQSDILICPNAQEMFKSEDFVVTEVPELAKLIRLSRSSLGFSWDVSNEKILKKIQEFGLELCSSDVAPEYRLKYQDQSLEQKSGLVVAMKPIKIRDGYWDGDIVEEYFILMRGSRFCLLASGDVDGENHREASGWDEISEYLFCLPKS